MKVVRSSPARTDRLYLPPGMFLVLIFTRGWVDPRSMVRSEGNMSLKNPVTPPGIDPGTVRLVAQRLNHYATQAPIHTVVSINKSVCWAYNVIGNEMDRSISCLTANIPVDKFRVLGWTLLVSQLADANTGDCSLWEQGCCWVERGCF